MHRNSLPMWRSNTVSPRGDNALNNPLSISTTHLSDRIIAHHQKNEKIDLHKTTNILFERALRPSLAPKNSDQTPEQSPETILRILMETCQSGEQGRESVKEIVQNLARKVITKRQPEDTFDVIRKAYNLLDHPSAEEIYHYNQAVAAQNDRIDALTSKLHLAVTVITSTMGAMIAILTALPDSSSTTPHTNDSQATVNSDTKKMAALVLSASVTLIGLVRTGVDNYQDAQKVKPIDPMHAQEVAGASVVTRSVPSL